MHKLISNEVEIVKDQFKIVEETRRFYKHLYSERTISNVNLIKILQDSFGGHKMYIRKAVILFRVFILFQKDYKKIPVRDCRIYI